jgi:hypothetical protein
LIVRPVLLLVLSVLVSASCGEGVDSASTSPSAALGGRRNIDCEAAPLPNPVFDIQGAEVPKSGHLRLVGVLHGIAHTGGQVEISLRSEMPGQVIVRLDFARPVQLDLLTGSKVEIDYWELQGFEGAARGIRIRDDRGLVLIADDGDYGNAILEEDLAPFTVAQADAGCRNRENRPGDLNNFKLAVSAGDAPVELMHGETGSLMISSREYAILALRSVAGVGNVSWTDAPYEYTSFVIARVPIE